MIIQPKRSVYKIVDKQDLFNKILQSTDFRKATNSLEAVKIMFNAVFPTLERVVDDNESLLTDQAYSMKQFAELDEKYKKLEEEYAAFRKRVQEETSQTPE